MWHCNHRMFQLTFSVTRRQAGHLRGASLRASIRSLSTASSFTPFSLLHLSFNRLTYSGSENLIPRSRMSFVTSCHTHTHTHMYRQSATSRTCGRKVKVIWEKNKPEVGDREARSTGGRGQGLTHALMWYQQYTAAVQECYGTYTSNNTLNNHWLTHTGKTIANTYSFLMPFSLIRWICWAWLIRIEDTKCPRPSKMYLLLTANWNACYCYITHLMPIINNKVNCVVNVASQQIPEFFRFNSRPHDFVEICEVFVVSGDSNIRVHIINSTEVVWLYIDTHTAVI